LEGTVANVPPQGGRKHPHQEIHGGGHDEHPLYCGGAFVGLEKIIEKRVGKSARWEFHTEAAPTTAQRRNTQLLEQVQPGDLIRYGLIPEFVAACGCRRDGDLDKGALVKILTEPKNALLKQYQRLFEFENVRLRFYGRCD